VIFWANGPEFEAGQEDNDLDVGIEMTRFNSIRAGWRRPSKREMVFAAALILVFSVLGTGLPFAPYDWLQQRVTAGLNSQPYNGNAVIIAIDEPTLTQLPDRSWDKNDLAILLTRINGNAPKQIIITPQFFDNAKANDRQGLAAAIKALPAKPVWQIDLSPKDAIKLSTSLRVSEKPKFADFSLGIDASIRPYVVPAIMTLRPGAFGAPLHAPYLATTDEGVFPSIGNLMADGKRPSHNIFNVDLSYNPDTIPTISAKAIMSGTYDATSLKNKRVVISHIGNFSRDTFHAVQNRYTPRAAGSVLAAQTLLDGPPVMLGWIPPYLLAVTGLLLWVFLARPYGRVAALSAILLLLFSPIFLEQTLIFQQTSQGIFLLIFMGVGKLWQWVRHAIETYRDAAETKSRFLAQASHDLRQPIHAVGLLADRLAQSDLTSSQAEIVSKISWSVDNAARMFRSLLDIAAIESGTLQTDIGPVAINELLAEIDSQNALVAEQAGVDLRLIPSELIVKTDRALVGTILQNLVSNAIKYAAGKTVIVGCRREGKNVALWVVDNGLGISETDLKHVQKEFYRSSDKSVLRSENKGLGLAIVSRLSKLLGLRFSLKSEKGRGTSAVIHSLAVISGQAEEMQSRGPSKMPLAGLKVAITDDDRETLLSTERILEQWGCEVKPYQSFPKGLTGYDVLLTDFDFGDSGTLADKQESIEQILKQNTQIIIISGHHPEQIREELDIETGLILSKPLRAAELRSALMATTLK
jgi:signal transduction histidine kinase